MYLLFNLFMNVVNNEYMLIMYLYQIKITSTTKK